MAGQQTNNFNTAKLAIWNNLYTTATYTNSTGSTVNLAKGRLMGRVSSSAKVLPHVKTATDGSEIPRFILNDDYTVANGASVTVSLIRGGGVAKDLVIYDGSDTAATAISRTYTDSGTDTVSVGYGIIEDILFANGIELMAGTELTGQDNQ